MCRATNVSVLPSLESMDIAVNPAGKIAGRSNLINNENSHAVSSIALWPETKMQTFSHLRSGASCTLLEIYTVVFGSLD